jgi:hypothetical protein
LDSKDTSHWEAPHWLRFPSEIINEALFLGMRSSLSMALPHIAPVLPGHERTWVGLSMNFSLEENRMPPCCVDGVMSTFGSIEAKKLIGYRYFVFVDWIPNKEFPY